MQTKKLSRFLPPAPYGQMVLREMSVVVRLFQGQQSISKTFLSVLDWISLQYGAIPSDVNVLEKYKNKKPSLPPPPPHPYPPPPKKKTEEEKIKRFKK